MLGIWINHSRGWANRPYDVIHGRIGPIEFWVPTPTLPIPKVKVRK